jgi:hypothetical protein
MAWNPGSPVTGAAQTGFTSPTYTLTADVAPDTNGKQYAITALGGTQAGVTAHSVASPFTLTFTKPKAARVLSVVNPVTGALKSVPRNVYQQLTRKGVTPLAGQPAVPMIVRTTIEVPAGADSYDAASIRAALSCHIGALWAQAAGIGDTAISAVM